VWVLQEMRDSTEDLEERLASFSSDQKETEAELSRMQAKRQAELKGLENARALMTRLEGEKGAILVQLKQQVSQSSQGMAWHGKGGWMCVDVEHVRADLSMCWCCWCRRAWWRTATRTSWPLARPTTSRRPSPSRTVR
jgi:hypothetical protein